MSIEVLHVLATKCTKPAVIGWFLGAVAWRTCGRDFAGAPAVGATTQRKKLAYNGHCVYDVFGRTQTLLV